MSGDGCVVALAARDAGGLEQGKNILRQQAAIESVEEDLPMKAL
jgi:hypothetical protein